MNIELKPCPFCGGEAEMMGDQYPYVECQECGAGFAANHSYNADEDDAASNWNSRRFGQDKMRRIAEKKIEKLAAVDEHGRTTWLGDEALFDSIKQRADAWLGLVELLNDLTPEWRQHPGTGRESAFAAIRGLAQAASAQGGQGAEPADGQWLIQMRGDYLTTRGVWERPDHRGYTNDINEAGRYSEEEARKAEQMMPEKCKAVRLPTARAQGGQGAEQISATLEHTEPEPVGFIPSSGLNNLNAGHPAKIYPMAATPSPFEPHSLVYTQPQPAQQGSVPEAMTALVAICQHLRDYVDNRGTSIVCDRGVNHFLDALKKAEQALSATLQPEGDGWIKCSERLPTEADDDFNGCVWARFEDGDIELIEGEEVEQTWDDDISITHWKPTGLKRPQPPVQGGDESE